MLLLAVLLAAAACGMAQRPMYAGSGPIGRPDLGTRFTTPAAPGLNNRFGDTGTTAAAPPIDLPVDALGDEDLVNRLNQWPREHRPFWLINAGAIEAHRNQNVNRPQDAQTQQVQPQPLGTRGNFQGNDDGNFNAFENEQVRPETPNADDEVSLEADDYD